MNLKRSRKSARKPCSLSKALNAELMMDISNEFKEFIDVKEALKYLQDLFPASKFNNKLPPLFFHHQLYGVLKNRTLVDKEIDKMRESCDLKLFKLSSNPREVCLAFTEDYVSHATNHLKNFELPQPLIDNFIDNVVRRVPDMSVTKAQFADLGINESEIRLLIGFSVLSVRDVGSWWLTVPNSGLFLTSLEKGRKILTNLIRKTKFKEILLSDLGQRPFHKSATLGLMYHLYDLIGADVVECIPTASSLLFKLL